MRTIIFIISIGLVSCNKINQTRLSVGQTWVYKRSKDPFIKSSIDTNVIINIKDGYVQYVQNKTDTTSDSKFWFVVGSDLIK